MSCSGILTAFSRLSLRSINSTTRHISTNVNPLCFRATNALFGEPLKKKRKLDPAIIKQREERRKRKIEKQIRRLEKSAKQLKPIADVDIPFKLIDQREKRVRNLPPLSEEMIEKRILLQKAWSKYKHGECLKDIQMLDTFMYSQQRALDELRAVSEDLYQAAIQIDYTLLPVTFVGPKHTPPIKNYDSPDGEYIDVTKKFEGEK